MTPTHQHDCELCQYLGTYKNKDLYFHPSDYKPSVISRYGSEGWEYISGIDGSLDGSLRVAAEIAIERSLITRQYWRDKAYFKGYYPYSIVKAVMMMSKEELFAFADRYTPFSSTDTPYELLKMVAEKRGWI